jgi:Predicted transcriptional regulator
MKQRLTAKEEQLMNIFWAHGPLFIRDLISFIPEPKPHYNTVATLVKFLEEKGFLEREPMANSFRYKVKISERQYHGDTVSDVVARPGTQGYEFATQSVTFLKGELFMEEPGSE